MRFTLIDRIVELEPGVKITALKALTQASAWLVRVSEDFAHSMVLLRQAANVKYGQFLEPGQTLVVAAEIVEDGARETRLKARGTVDGQVIVSARLVLAKYNLSDSRPGYERADRATRQDLREAFALLYQPGAPVRETSTS